MPKRLYLIGKRFGRLIVIANLTPSPRPGGKLHYRVKCICDCGNQTEVDTSNLIAEHTRSCGCLQKESRTTNHLIHGHARKKRISATYKTWEGMLDRCRNSNTPTFSNYGGRGIIVCTRWHSFENFLADMGERPSGKTIERINNNGNYEPDNCCWATPLKQARNKRNNVIITVNGITASIPELCERFNIPQARVRARIKRLGWPFKDAFTQPIHTRILNSYSSEPLSKA